MNQFSDMSNQEYQTMIGSCLGSFITETHSESSFFQPEGGTAQPKTVDWIEKGYVTAVKNQKTCGSCWAFSATGALEGQMFKKTRKLVPLSEQQLVDCSFKFRNSGCGGGSKGNAVKYIMSRGGLQAEDSYPYENMDGKCRFNQCKVVATCRGYRRVISGNEKVLQEAVASVGPVSVSIDASRDTFQLYKSGVYDDEFCTNSNLTHAVLVVGYGSEGNKDYWLVKNSWDVNWGNKGYIKMSMNNNNQCCVATRAVYPVV